MEIIYFFEKISETFLLSSTKRFIIFYLPVSSSSKKLKFFSSLHSTELKGSITLNHKILPFGQHRLSYLIWFKVWPNKLLFIVLGIYFRDSSAAVTIGIEMAFILGAIFILIVTQLFGLTVQTAVEGVSSREICHQVWYCGDTCVRLSQLYYYY